MATDPNDIYETCTAAADLLERDGWMQGTFWPGFTEQKARVEGEPMCLAGALRAALGQAYHQSGFGDPMWAVCPATVAVAREAAARQAPYASINLARIYQFNDDENTAAAAAIALLRDVAAKYQPDEYRCGGG